MMHRVRWIYAALVCVLIIVYYAAPAARSAAVAVIGAVGASAIIWSAITRRPARWVAWLLIAAAVLVLGVGITFYTILATGARPIDFPSVPDELIAAAYLPLAAGALWLGLERSRSRDWSAVIDVSVVSLAVALIVWLTLVHPDFQSLHITAVQKTVGIATGVGDVVVFAAAVRMLFVWRRNTSVALLAAALTGLITSDVLYNIALARGEWHSGGPIDLGFLLFLGLCGAAALEPSMTMHGSERRVENIGIGGLAVLAVALLAAPIAMIVEARPDPSRTPIAIAIVSVVVALLVALRLAGVARARELTLEQAAVVRRASRQLGLAMTPADVVASLDGALAGLASGSPTSVRIADERPPDHPDVRGVDRPHDVVFEAPPGELDDLDDMLNGLADQASIALRRIDLIARVQASEKEQDVLAYRASHDGLTGLANAQLFRDELRAARHLASDDHITAVLFIDLDDFKSINDALGHEVGDAVLVISAQRIQSCLRRGDLAARLGGDEFAVLLRDLSQEVPAQLVASRITQALAERAQVSGIPVDCAGSVGLATATNAPDYDTLLQRADTALYSAKAAGRGQWRPYHPDMHSPFRRGIDLRAELESTLRQGANGLTMHYQPIVALSSGELRGFEALIRWEHPTYGPIPVEDLIAVAEHTGLIVPLGSWVLGRAITDAVRLAPAGDASKRYVSVNVSAAQLRQADIVDQIRHRLDAAGLDPTSLVIEVTERQLLRDDEHLWADLAELRKQGVRIAIDDYGTGYSSIGYLRHPVFDILKLDKSFLDDVEAVRSQILLRGVLRLTGELQLDLIAEGIEDEVTRTVLINLGCRFGQGHIFAPAMPLDEALAWSSQHS